MKYTLGNEELSETLRELNNRKLSVEHKVNDWLERSQGSDKVKKNKSVTDLQSNEVTAVMEEVWITIK